MVKVRSIPYIHCEDVKELIGEHWAHCEFAQMAEDGSYQHIWCDEDSVQQAKEEFEDEAESWGNISRESFSDEEEYERWKRTSSVARLRNQYNLVKALNEMGYDEMLIFVTW